MQSVDGEEEAAAAAALIRLESNLESARDLVPGFSSCAIYSR